jgi:DNA repair exonuclease SbcCD ATPase subunit
LSEDLDADLLATYLQRKERVKTRLKAVESRIKLLKKRHRTYRENFDTVVSSGVCPTCLQPLSLKYKYEYSERISKMIRKVEGVLEDCNKEVDQLMTQLAEIDAKLDDIKRGSNSKQQTS